MSGIVNAAISGSLMNFTLRYAAVRRAVVYTPCLPKAPVSGATVG